MYNTIAIDLKNMLEHITKEKWETMPIFDEDLTIYNDFLNIEIDLIFDLKKIRIKNYNTNKKDKIVFPKQIDQEFENYIKQFL